MVRLADIYPVAPADVPNASVVGWVVLAIVLAVVVAGGVYLTSRR